MSAGYQTPMVANEPVLEYRPESAEREALKAKLAELRSQEIEIPLIIGGQEVRTGNVTRAVMPHRHGHLLATWHRAGQGEVEQAAQAAVEAQHEWASWPWHERAGVFLRAADLLATSWRQVLNASTMLGQSKTAHQAEIDSACELIDFFRFNVAFAEQIFADQPISSSGMWNRMDYRPLEGFVYAVTPFNFTSIAGNLPTSPAIMGNTVVWKPSSTAVFSGYYIIRMLEEAGLPPGVINFVPGQASEITNVVTRRPEFAGLHFTGSTAVFRELWGITAKNLEHYRSYPRIVGETGGKDFVLAHSSADPDALRTALVRGAFEYQGQKCSAASRAYVPESLWRTMGDDFLHRVSAIDMGDVEDFRNFMGAVINKSAYDKISGYIEHARQSGTDQIMVGGEADDTAGYFIRPTVIRSSDPDTRVMCEEIFGPVLSVYVYADNDWEQALRLVDRGSPYGLTGAVFAQDRNAVQQAETQLRFAAGNFYINDKPTGAVVGQQPFGGGRASGTNDKAGSALNLVRWLSARSIKETFTPPTDYRYPFMEKE